MGAWQTEEQNVEKIVVDYFSNIFSTSTPSEEAIDSVTSAIPTSVTIGMNSFLNTPFSEEEVKSALWQLHPSKAPGPDGFPSLFFQKFWDFVRVPFVKKCLDVLNGNESPADINKTLIALIPKVKNPTVVSQYRPISLCNVAYKVITKAMATRLKTILDKVISCNQSAFIPGRLITDNVIVAFECLHKLKSIKKANLCYAALKLDFSKAYDRVEWSFLQADMEKMGFSSKWIQLVLRCITTASFSVLINGEAKGNIVPSRGLRQGCPISPYLFLFCAEALSTLIIRAEEENVLHGLKINKRSPSVSHLLFADDSLLFFKANKANAMEVQRILHAYEAASGQLVNFDKLAIAVSPGTDSGLANELKTLLMVEQVSCHANYLGLPSSISRNKKDAFSVVRERFSKKVSGWQERLFSVGGKEVLIKAILQAIPTYPMSLFRLPVGLCNDLENMACDFWWGYSKKKKNLHWQSWERLSKAKREGGMGFRDIVAFNQAMLAKQVWRLIRNPSSLVHRLLKSVYFPHTSFMKSKVGHHPSFIWRSIMWGRELIDHGSYWRVGDGRSIAIYRDKWIPRPSNFRIFSPQTSNEIWYVSDLFSLDGQWDHGIIKSHFIEEDYKAITSLFLSWRMREDILVWHYNDKGEYTVKSGYHVAKNVLDFDRPTSSSSVASERWWNFLWSLSIPSKIKIFCWRACNNAILTKEALLRRNIVKDSFCHACKLSSESVFHALVLCKHARKVWRLSRWRDLFCGKEEVDFCQFIANLFDSKLVDQFEEVVVLCWSIWYSRNLLVNTSISVEPLETYNRALRMIDSLAMGKHLQTAPAASPNLPRWNPLSGGCFKLNVDASVIADDGLVGYGFVVRNDQGSPLVVGSRGEHRCCSILEAEATSLLWGIKEACARNFFPLFVESDNLTLVDLVHGKVVSSLGVGLIILDVFDFIKDNDYVSFQHISRVVNSVAHVAASLGLSCNEALWERDFPSSIIALCCKDIYL